MKKSIPTNLQRGITLSIRPGHTAHLEVTREFLTVQTGLSLFYAMVEALAIPPINKEVAFFCEGEVIRNCRLKYGH